MVKIGIKICTDWFLVCGWFIEGKVGCGIADNDFEAAFDFLCLDWVKLVLKKKGLADEALARFTNIYNDGITLPVVNNIVGKAISNNRLSLRQGDRPSGIWFCFGIDPLLIYLQNRLSGILIHTLPVHGPAQPDQVAPLPPLETRYKVLGYLDDCKPAITTMSEFSLVDRACNLFELSSGCKLHRDPATEKCKFLALGRWKGVLTQEDIPLPYLKLTEHLDYLGCKLFANFPTTRKENGQILKKKVQDQVGSWKAGKFLPLTSRPWSLNTYCLSKLWYRTACLDLNVGDSDSITSSVKGWLYQDLLLKPQELILYRETKEGGLGLFNVKARALAMLIHTFLAQSISPLFPTNHYHSSLFRWHVLEERDIPDPGRPPYYSANFFSIIRDVKENTPLILKWITVKQWYQLLLERGVTHNSDDPDTPPVKIASKLELSSPGRDFSDTYRLTRLFGLSPDQKSFLFKLLHRLLPTRERLFRVGKAESPNCVYCPGQLDNIEHLFSCSNSSHLMTPVLNCLTATLDNVTPEALSTMNISPAESMELPTAWLISTSLSLVWEARSTGKQLAFTSFNSELLARVAILKKTKWKHYTLHNSALLLDEMLSHVN